MCFLAFGNADAAVLANHSSLRQSHSIKKDWIIGLDSPDFPITAQLYLATGLWPSQSQRLAVAKNHSLHPKSGRTSLDPNFSTGNPGTSCLATISLSLRDKSHPSIEAPHKYLSAYGVKPREPAPNPTAP